MEFTKAEIAVLVLGYLKDEELCNVAAQFERESPQVQKKKENCKNAKFLPTRVNEMSLANYLEEYATIATIVSGYLEQTAYYKVEKRNIQTSLVDKICYLLDTDVGSAATSTPILSGASEVDATPAHTLPGNSCTEDYSTPKNLKRKSIKNKNRDKDEAMDVSEVLTQSLLENHELHEKIAETINMELAKSVADEHISAGASKELDAIIKTVVQRTEEDPAYNKLLDEIIGTPSVENPPHKKSQPFNSSFHKYSNVDDTPKLKPSISDTQEDNDQIDDHNNDAVRSIIEAAQKTDQPTTQSINTESGEVYVFEGTLDNFLKSSCGTTNPVPTNPLFINTGGLLVMPPETASQQFYIVNNQPVLNMNVSSVPNIITDDDIMQMPTIIVNDQISQQFAVSAAKKSARPKKIVPKVTKAAGLDEFLCLKRGAAPEQKNNKAVVEPESDTQSSNSTNQQISAELTSSEDVVEPTPKQKKQKPKKKEVSNPAPEAVPEQTTPSASSPRPASHVRNLDFSTPTKGVATVVAPAETPKAWDSDLRTLANSNVLRKLPTPKKRRGAASKTRRKSPKRKKKEEKKAVKEKSSVKEEKEKAIAPPQSSAKEEETQAPPQSSAKEEETQAPPQSIAEEETQAPPQTPEKDVIPLTPGGERLAPPTGGILCTPFNDVLDEHLNGVDLMSLPTPKIPITPGFALTPGEVLGYNNRGTDYSTSSSYYQPSDTEQNKSIDQLIEETRKLDVSPQRADKFADLRVLSDVVVLAQAEKTCEVRKRFNHNVIGKKNLNLLNSSVTSSSSSEGSDSETENFGEHEKTMIFKRGESIETNAMLSEKTDDKDSDLTKVSTAAEEKSGKGKSKKKRDSSKVKTTQEERYNKGNTKKKSTKAESKGKLNKERDSTEVKTTVDEGTKSNEKEEATVAKIILEEETDNKDNCKEIPDSTATIKNIISDVAVSDMIDKEVRRKTILLQMEEKRQRTIQRMNNPPEATKKPKNNRRSVATSKATKKSKKKDPSIGENTDEEAQKLVNGLAQRGIHLIPNKTPQKKVGPVEQPKVAVDDSFPVFDVKVYDSCESVVHDETCNTGKIIEDYDFDVLKKTFKAQLYIEELKKEDTRTMQWNPIIFIDISQPKERTADDDLMDELMDSVVTGSLQQESPDAKQATKGGRKRKVRLSDDDVAKPSEKKSKAYQKNMKLLKKIDVDDFLDIVHGE